MIFNEIVNEYGDYCESIEINGIRVYVFEEHNLALPIWGFESETYKAPLHLITFDTHTDTQKPFTSANTIGEKAAFQGKHYKRNDFDFHDVWYVSSLYLRNTEQILAGVKYNYLSSYCVIQNRGAVENGYEEYDCSEGYNAKYFEKADIDWDYLMNVQVPIALDFDLDFFNSSEELNGIFREKIKQLIRKVNFITIAKETWHFNDCKVQEDFQVKQALTMLFEIIEEA